jgi:hypothetical protein
MSEQTKYAIYGNQPLDTIQGNWLLVTVTQYEVDGENEMTEIIDEFVMPDGSRTQTWLEGLKDYDRKVEWRPIVQKTQPKVVHAVISISGAESDFTACRISSERWKKYHQTLDQAFHRVMERPNCKTCQVAVRGTQWKPDWDAGILGGATLKQWDWENVDEDYRPGGSKHHWSRTTP